MLIQLLANGLVNGCLYAILALGYAFIYNTTRIFHVAHGAVFIVGAYAAYFGLMRLGWPVPVAIILAMGAASFLGILIEVGIYAPLGRRHATLMVPLLSSLGLYVALVNVVALIFGNETKILQPGLGTTYQLGPVILARTQVAEVVAALIAMPIMVAFLKFSPLGQAVRAVRDNSILASVQGINVAGVRVLVFALGSALAGLAATLQAMDVGMDPSAGMSALLVAAVALTVGGIGTFEGPIVGAFLLGILQSLVVWKLSARWSDALVFVMLIFFLIFRPEGIMGRRTRVEEAA
jgi:branched-chain amino acid transport system permease protein